MQGFLLQLLVCFVAVGALVLAVYTFLKTLWRQRQSGRTISVEIRHKLGLTQRVEVDPQSLQSIEALLKKAKAASMEELGGESQTATTPGKAP